MTDFLERINRWADNLPPDELIPIAPMERYELARLAVEIDWQRCRPIETVVQSIGNGTFRFRAHRVVVL